MRGITATVLLLVATGCSIQVPVVSQGAVIAMSAATDTVNESDGSVIVCAELATGIIPDECGTSVAFGFISPSDTACFLDNYNASAVPVPLDQGMACLDITIIQDSLFRGSEHFTVFIDSLEVACSEDITSSSSPTVVTIEDDEQAMVSFSVNSHTVDEGDSVTLTFEFVDSLAAQIATSIDFSVTIVNSSDFTLNTTILLNQFQVTVKSPTSVIFMAEADGLLEGPETFILEVDTTSLPLGVNISGPSSQAITILDGDHATIGLQSWHVAEGKVEEVCAVLTVPPGGSEVALTVTFAVDNGTKTVEGDDFLVVSPLVVEFLPTEVNGTQQCINISIKSDGILEGNHSFLVNLIQVSLDLVTLSPSSVIIDIMDGDIVSVQLEEPSAVSEGDNLTVCATLTFLGATTALECDITVYLDTANGNAELDIDYSTTFSITFDSGSDNGSIACVGIPTDSNQALDGDRNFSISLTSSNLENNIHLSSQLVTAVINDDENATVGFQQLSYNIPEGNGSVDVCVEIFDVPIDGAECDITVYLSSSNGAKAVSGEDFAVPDPLEVVFMADAVVSGSTACVTISIVDDNALEGPHSFNMSIVGSDPPLMTINPQAQVVIGDNEDATVGFQQLSYNIPEGNGSVDVCVEIFDVPNGGAECDVTIYLSSSDGAKAVSGEDFTVPDPLEVVFMADTVVSGSTACVTISIVDDDALEGPHSFNMSIVGSDPPLMTINPQTQVVIEDNEGNSTNNTTSNNLIIVIASSIGAAAAVFLLIMIFGSVIIALIYHHRHKRVSHVMDNVTVGGYMYGNNGCGYGEELVSIR